MKDKINVFITILTKKKKIEFYLYNVTYIIYIQEEKYVIRQINSNIEYLYDDLKLLFNSYKIYGQSLAQCFKNIFIIIK